MILPFPGRGAAALAAVGLAAVTLAACSRGPVPESRPAFYARLDQTGGAVDPASSLSMINLHRSNKGLPALVWDPAVARVAQAQVDRMAAADKVQSVEEAHLDQDLAAAGIAHKSFLANFSAGYRTFAEAFSGWRESKVHDATMLAPRATRIGLATAQAPHSKYKIFWTLVVIEPK